MPRETDLYPPVKRFLEAAGYEVKAEVRGCDVVAVRDGAPMLVVELKLAFSLDLVLQGIARQQLSDDVYIAVPAPDTPGKRRNWRSRQRGLKGLCRRLGLGLMLVDPSRAEGRDVTVLLDPAPYQPRKAKHRQARLVQEFRARAGDPNIAGSTRRTIMTAYRQDAILCARALEAGGEMSPRAIREETGVTRAGAILQANHYGWFDRVERGIYRLTEAGRMAATAAAE